MTGLAAWLAPVLLSSATPQPLLARQPIRGWWLGCGRGVLLPQRQLSFQVGYLLLGLNQLFIAFGQFLLKSFHLTAEALVFALQLPRVGLRRFHSPQLAMLAV
jgi:hypothetical protein